jgi:hypothetical protein
MNIAKLQAQVAYIDEREAADWEETTRDEREWMRQFRDLANYLIALIPPGVRPAPAESWEPSCGCELRHG